ncbi:carboxylesterase 1-like [Silene latifolia]|uniref:carboxylesterase 1-like n=1 Tax=Silene latifolia TaxID=37657 RepID=UPI003D788E52
MVRTGSELNLIDDPYVPLSANDLFWELSLPVGADRDHEYSNLKIGEGMELWNRMKQVGWRVLVTGCSGDPLVDRQVELVKLLKEKGVMVKGHFTEGDYHAVDVFDQLKFRSFLLLVKDFMSA